MTDEKDNKPLVESNCSEVVVVEETTAGLHITIGSTLLDANELTGLVVWLKQELTKDNHKEKKETSYID